jgi:hypothetical protein
MSIVTKLDVRSSIEQWRKAKDLLDEKGCYENQLGCVGRPIAELLTSLIAALPEDQRDSAIADANAAAAEARGHLLDYVNDARIDAADFIADTISEALSDVGPNDIEVDASDSIEDIFNAGIEEAQNFVNSVAWTQCYLHTLESEEL